MEEEDKILLMAEFETDFPMMEANVNVDPFSATDDEMDPDYDPHVEENPANKIYDYFKVNQPQPHTSKCNIQEKEPTTNTTIKYNTVDTPLFDGKFFKILQKDDDNVGVKAECQACLPTTKHIKGRLTSTTNFLKHLKTKHNTAYNDYIKYKVAKKKLKPSKSKLIKPNVLENSNNKQIDIKTSFTKSKIVSQIEFDQRIIKFIVNTMSAVSIIENPSFIQIFEGMNLKLISRGTALKRISDLCKGSLENIKKELLNVQYVCTTADIWSSKKRSFLGVTCHWIQDDFERKSVALACRRFTGSHSFDRIGELLDEIHTAFQLNTTKVVGTITDNGSNFVKAFKEYGVHISEDVLVNSAITNSTTANFATDDSDNVETYNEDIQDILFEPITSENIENVDIYLPKHIRCVTHTINLIATSDIMKSINNNQAHRSKHTLIMSKCTQLWNKAGRPKTAEIIKETLGHYLSYPGLTRWNSYYDSINQILKEKENLTTLFNRLNIKQHCLRDAEIEYLTEYVEILKPLALAIDILQGENSMFFGIVIPTIASIKIKLQKLKTKNIKYLSTVLDTCINSVTIRFKNYLTLSNASQDAAIATTTHPQFKLRWVAMIKDVEGINKKVEDIKKIIIQAANEVCEENRSLERNVTNPNIIGQDFFEFEDDGGSTTNANAYNNYSGGEGEVQFLQYLQDAKTEIEVLNRYPCIKRLFVKYNTTLPSSAPVERMFSYATFINSPRRHALSDINFENLVLLKANKV